MTSLDSILKKQRHHFVDKGPNSQNYGFSSSHVLMWELSHKEGWVLKNWCFQTVVLETTLESPLNCKIKSVNAAAAAKSLQSCPTLCDPIDGRPPGSAVPGILQTRTLEWVAISFSNAWKWKVKVKSLSRVRHFTTPWTAAHQAPLPMGFSSQEYWSGVPLPSPLVGLESI